VSEFSLSSLLEVGVCEIYVSRWYGVERGLLSCRFGVRVTFLLARHARGRVCFGVVCVGSP